MTATEENNMLILSGNGYSLTIAESAEAKKSELLKHSSLIIEINDPASSEAAGNQIKKLAEMRNLTERSRTAVKAPVLAVGKKIDTLASDFQAELTAQETRLKKLQGDYALKVAAERKRVLDEMEAARRAEQERIRKEEQAKQEAEAKRIAAEQAAWEADSEEDEAAAAKAKLEADAEAKRVADAAAAEAAKRAEQVITPAFVPVAPKGVKMVADYELTDIDALYRHNVSLVTLSEKRKEILEAIARGMIGDEPPQIPGLRTFMRPQVR